MIEYTPYKRQMLAHCQRWIDLDPAQAQRSANWFEKNEPWALAGLSERVKRDIAERESASGSSCADQ